MATKKKSVKKASSKSTEVSNLIGAAAGILFAGAAVALVGCMQNDNNIQLLLVGFGAALLVLGGVVLGSAAKPVKKK